MTVHVKLIHNQSCSSSKDGNGVNEQQMTSISNITISTDVLCMVIDHLAVSSISLATASWYIIISSRLPSRML